MAVKKKVKKAVKEGRNDATMRNVRAANRKIAELSKKLEALHNRVADVEYRELTRTYTEDVLINAIQSNYKGVHTLIRGILNAAANAEAHDCTDAPNT